MKTPEIIGHVIIDPTTGEQYISVNMYNTALTERNEARQQRNALADAGKELMKTAHDVDWRKDLARKMMREALAAVKGENP